MSMPRDGLTEDKTAAILYGVCGLGFLVWNSRWRWPLATSLALALLAGSTLWWLRFGFGERLPLWGEVLAVEAAVMGIAAVLLGHPRKPGYLNEPLARSAEVLSAVALIASLWVLASTPCRASEPVVAGGILFGLYCLLAAVERRKVLGFVSGLMLIATAVAAGGWWSINHTAYPPIQFIVLTVAAASTILVVLALGVERFLSSPEDSAHPFSLLCALRVAPMARRLLRGVVQLAAIAAVAGLLLNSPFSAYSPLFAWAAVFLARQFGFLPGCRLCDSDLGRFLFGPGNHDLLACSAGNDPSHSKSLFRSRPTSPREYDPGCRFGAEMAGDGRINRRLLELPPIMRPFMRD